MLIKIMIATLLFFFNSAISFENIRDPFSLPKPIVIKPTTLHIQYANAMKLGVLLNDKNNGFLSSQGRVLADERTNTLWVEDDFIHTAKIKKFLMAIDTPIRQVLLKAKIVMMDQYSLQEIGAYFSAANPDLQEPLMSAITIPLINFGQQQSVNLTLTALEQHGHIHTIAEPELITNNRQSATIESGEEIPYQEKTGQGNTSTTFKKAVLLLKVTPTILPNGKILLTVFVSENKPSLLLIQGVPSITTQQLKTQVVINNLQTLILGGINQQTNDTTHSAIPFFRHIPLLGKLFSSNHHNASKKQLVIFITPQIL